MRANTTTLVVFLLLVGARVQAQESLDAAKELYASAEYDRALTMLDGLKVSQRPREEQQTIELYRVLCLVATGKEADAKGVMEGLVTRDPLYRPSNDLPPRVRSTYSETRKRLLPSAAQSVYQEAKAAFDFKDYRTAERGFALVLEVLADPDVQAQATKSPLSDIRMLATGFHELSAKAATPPIPWREPSRNRRPSFQSCRHAAARREGLQRRRPERRAADHRESADPTVPRPGPSRADRCDRVVIDTRGEVESATMVASVNPQTHRFALGARRLWQYQPAEGQHERR